MKLELKHLVGYLPYGLNVSYQNDKLEVIGIYLDDRNFYVKSIEEGNYYVNADFAKPILRPLSDLFKSKHLLDKADDFCIEMIEQNKIECLPYGYIQLLLENHIDVFGLIPQGLAIDINNC